jgi:hypothetical protein
VFGWGSRVESCRVAPVRTLFGSRAGRGRSGQIGNIPERCCTGGDRKIGGVTRPAGRPRSSSLIRPLTHPSLTSRPPRWNPSRRRLPSYIRAAAAAREGAAAAAREGAAAAAEREGAAAAAAATCEALAAAARDTGNLLLQ